MQLTTAAARDARGQLVRAGERVRPACGHADDGEAPLAERVGELGDVACELAQRAARQRVRATEARTADHDVADAQLVDHRFELRARDLRRADRAVQVDDEQPVARADRSQASRLPSRRTTAVRRGGHVRAAGACAERSCRRAPEHALEGVGERRRTLDHRDVPGAVDDFADRVRAEARAWSAARRAG